MDEIQEHYAQLKKPYTKAYMLYILNLIYMNF